MRTSIFVLQYSLEKVSGHASFFCVKTHKLNVRGVWRAAYCCIQAGGRATGPAGGLAEAASSSPALILIVHPLPTQGLAVLSLSLDPKKEMAGPYNMLSTLNSSSTRSGLAEKLPCTTSYISRILNNVDACFSLMLMLQNSSLTLELLRLLMSA